MRDADSAPVPQAWEVWAPALVAQACEELARTIDQWALWTTLEAFGLSHVLDASED